MTENRQYVLERVDDAVVVQLYAEGFDRLTRTQKILAWHLYQAALAGRDIYYDQRYAHNLEMRAVLEGILTHARRVQPRVLAEIRRYTKLFWINTGPYNNITALKFLLRLEPQELLHAIRDAAADGAEFPVQTGESLEAMAERLSPFFFDGSVDPVLTSKTPGAGRDILTASANNLYDGVTMADVERFDERHGLNSRLVMRDGRVEEEVYRIGGRYDTEIRRIVHHLEAACAVAPEATNKALAALIRFYRTGEDADRVDYDVAWVADKDAAVDTINGFVEVYMDPRGTKGAWEGVVYYVDEERTRRIGALAAHAQWFEDRMPWADRFRKARVQGVTAKAIQVVVETGDSGPLTPLGINLPNDQAVREQHGSKSVSLANVTDAYERATPEGLRTEFAWTADEAGRARRWAAAAQELTTDMHEVIGHGSGRMAPDVTAPPHLMLKEQYSAIEESRADLVALYFLPDPELVSLGLVDPAHHADLVLAEYEHYTRTALVQLRRIRSGAQIEEDHMRNRQMIVSWLRANTTAIDERHRDGKTYYVMTDVHAFREGVGQLLAEVQRIKGEGDYAAAKALFERHGIHFDPALRDQVVARVDALDLPSYTAFVMPRLQARHGSDGAIVDVEMSYPCDFEAQMLEYSASGRGTPSAVRR